VSLLSLSAGNPMRTAVRSVLIFEVIVFGLAIPVMILVSHVPGAVAGGLAGGAALLAALAAGLLRSPLGYPVGWLAQLAGVMLGVLTPGMFIAGGIFLGVWLLAFILGKKLDGRPAQDVADSTSAGQEPDGSESAEG
jgi:Protein of unknown function (DUF4233)